MKIMGVTKEFGTEQDDKRAVAMDIALKVGLVQRCDVHGCLYDAMNDFVLEDAIRYGETLMARSDPLVAVFGGNRKRLRHAIENIRTGLPNCCDECFYTGHDQ
jgi:hypothetical protein